DVRARRHHELQLIAIALGIARARRAWHGFEFYALILCPSCASAGRWILLRQAGLTRGQAGLKAALQLVNHLWAAFGAQLPGKLRQGLRQRYPRFHEAS